MATKKPMKNPAKRVRRFQEGGEASDKAAGLAASNMDPRMSFFERLRMGNIDQEGSEAYNRLGAGRGRGERAALSELAGMTASNNAMPLKIAEDGPAQNVRIADAQGAREMDEEMYQRAVREGERDEKRMAPSLAKTQNAAILAAKPSRTASGKTTGDFTRLDRKALLPSGPNVKFAPGGANKRRSASTEELAASLAAAKPTATSAATTKEERQARIDQAFKPPSDEQIQKGLEAGTLGAGLSLKTLAGLAKNLANRQAKKAPGSGFILKEGRFVKDPNAPTRRPRKALPSPITDVTAKNVNPRSVTGSAREDAKADRFRRGLDELSAKQMAEKNLRERGNKFLFADDAMKRGGRVKKMASGGSVKSSVSSASRRGDGIALRGKTRGKMY